MRKLLYIAASLVLAAYAATGLYNVEPEETAVAYLFGRIVNAHVPSGMHWNFPAPFGKQVVMPTRLTQVLNVGYGNYAAPFRDEPAGEDLWLTGGASIVECRLDIQYSISQLDRFLLSHEDPGNFMRLSAERALTRFLAGAHVDDILTTQRQVLVLELKAELQRAMDEQSLGIDIQDVSVVNLAPPRMGAVSDAFRQVQSARSERERAVENAKSEAAQVLFEVNAEAESLNSRSQAEKFARVEQARAEASRFQALAREQKLAPELTRKRLYRDMVPAALQRAKIYIVPSDSEGLTVE